MTAIPIDLGSLSTLLGELHAAAQQSTKVQAFLRQCGLRLGAVSGVLAVCEKGSRRWRYVDYYPPADPAASAYYETRYGADDPVRAAVLAAPARRVYRRSDLVDDYVVATHPYFTDYYQQLGYGDVLVARIPVSTDYDCLFSFIRATGERPFGPGEVGLLQMLLPHIEEGLRLHNFLDRHSVFADIAQEQFRQSGQGLVVLDGDGRKVFANRVAAALLKDESLFGCDSERIALRDEHAAPRFDGLLRECIGVDDAEASRAGGSIAVATAGGVTLLLTLAPFRAGLAGLALLQRGPRVLLTLFQPAAGGFDRRAELREMYRLSAAEADVCWRIGNGASVAEVAAAAGWTRDIVRSHLKRVFHKTMTGRQAELVRLVLLGPAAWSRLVGLAGLCLLGDASSLAA